MKDAILSLFATEIINPLVIALGHSLWQSGLAALILIAVFTKLGSHRPAARYAAALTALGISVTAFLVTFALLRTEPALPADIFTPAPIASAPAETAAPPAAPITISPLPTPTQANWEPLLFALWLAGVTCFLLRTARSYHALGKLRRSAEPITSPALQKILATVQNQLGCLRPVVLLQCEKLGSPAVAGFLRPAIFLPAAMVTGCDEATLRAVLAHEIAHLRRHDYLVNLAQMVIEALFFFSPAIWWISHQLRNEREAACDQLAASTCGSPQTYAASLLAWVETNSPAPQTALAVSGRDPNNLASRLRRLFGTPEARVSTPFLLTAIALAFLGLLGTRATVHADEWKATIALALEKIDSQPIHPEPVRATITGRVLDSAGELIKTGKIHDDFIFNIEALPESIYQANFESPGIIQSNFEHTGSVNIYVWHRGYAPVRIEAVELTAGIDITLPEGFSYKVEVMSSAGIPVSDAKVTYSLDGKNGRWAHTRSGDDGVAILKHLSGKRLGLTIDAPGFAQTFVHDIDLHPGGIQRVTLEPSNPVTLKFVEAGTGDPVPNVQLSVEGLRKAQRSWLRRAEEHNAISGSDGRAEISGLPVESQSWISAVAEGFENRVIGEVRPGETRTIPLKKEIIATLEIAIPKSVRDHCTEKSITMEIAQWQSYGTGQKEVWRTELIIPITGTTFTTTFPLAWERAYENCIPYYIGYPGAVKNERPSLPRPDENGVIEITLPEYKGSLETSDREIVYRLSLPEGSVETPILDIELKDARRAYVPRRIPFVNGEARTSIKAPASVDGKHSILGLKHLAFDTRKLRVDIPAGNTPFVIELGEAIPGGTLLVDLKLPPGTTLNDTPLHDILSLHQLRRPATLHSNHMNDSVDFLRQTSKNNAFIISRVPFGEKYFLQFHHGDLRMQSNTFKLKASKPVKKIVLSKWRSR